MRGTIVKQTLKSGRVRWGYYIEKGIRPDGKRNQEKKIRWEVKRDAVNALQKRIVELETPAEAKSDVTFREFYQKWAEGDEGCGHAHWAPSTRKSNRRYIAYAFCALGDVKLVELSPKIIQTALYKLHKSCGVKGGPLCPKTLQEMMTLTSQCLTQARKWKLFRRTRAKT